MGVVVAAQHLELDSLVAIKFLLPDVLQNADVVARFAREARAAARIKSEHVVRVTDVGTLPTGAPYMVMEFLEGADLSALVQSRGSLPEVEAVDYLLQALEAIAEAHKAGIVHRDLKPANLFLSRRADGSELIKVLDFGISKMSDGNGFGSGGKMTSTSALLGSPVYMSPEQLTSSRDVDGRTDIWSLGIILYELLSGRQPFIADTVPQLCISILQHDPIPLASLRSDVAPGLQAVIARCIEKDRGRRYATVGDLAAALAPFAGPSSRLSIDRILRLLPPSAGAGGAAVSRGTPTAQPGATSGTTQVLPAASTTGNRSASTTGNRAGRHGFVPRDAGAHRPLVTLGVGASASARPGHRRDRHRRGGDRRLGGRRVAAFAAPPGPRDCRPGGDAGPSAAHRTGPGRRCGSRGAADSTCPAHPDSHCSRGRAGGCPGRTAGAGPNQHATARARR